MDTIVQEVQDHLQAVTQDPSKPLDERILSKLDTNLIDNLPSIRKRMLVNQLATLLPQLQQDPTAVAELATLLISSDDLLTFEEVLDLKPEVNFVGGLQAPIPALNKVTLALLQKAKTPADAGLVAGRSELVSALVQLWLRANQTTVAEMARSVLGGLLAAESPEPRSRESSPPLASPTQGLMWRRVFNDKDVYGLIYSTCSVKTLGQQGQLTRREKTIAQGRLLDLIQEIYHAPQIWKSQIAEIEQAYGVTDGGGLLEFAAVHMIDYKDDVLIHMTLIDFFTGLISRATEESSLLSSHEGQHASEILEFLVDKGLHSRTMSYFLTPDQHDSLDATYLYSSSTHYIAAYATHYEDHFLKTTAKQVLKRLSEVLGSVPTSAWANNQAPAHDLKLLSSLPAKSLLVIDRGDLVQSILTTRGNVDAYHTLDSVFHGPRSPMNIDFTNKIVPPKNSSGVNTEGLQQNQAAARALFFLYVQDHQNFWQGVVSAAETTALKEVAIAAVDLIHSIVDSVWAPLPSEAGDLPSEEQLERKCTHQQIRPLPGHGVLAVLQPPAIQYVMPYLMKGPENPSEAAWEIAVAKHQVIVTMKQKLQELMPELGGGEWKDILNAIEKRASEGPAGRKEGGIRDTMPVIGTMGR